MPDLHICAISVLVGEADVIFVALGANRGRSQHPRSRISGGAASDLVYLTTASTPERETLKAPKPFCQANFLPNLCFIHRDEFAFTIASFRINVSRAAAV